MPQLLSLNVKIVLTVIYQDCHVLLHPFSLQNSLSNLGPFPHVFLGTTDLHVDTATIETLTELLIVRLEVVGCWL